MTSTTRCSTSCARSRPTTRSWSRRTRRPSGSAASRSPTWSRSAIPSRCCRWPTSARPRSCGRGCSGCATTSRARGSRSRSSSSSPSRRSTAWRCRCCTATGVLERGATRGNGEVGEDVTHNIRTIASVPLRLEMDDPPALVEVRGEVYMSLPDFAALNERRAEAGLSTFMNPRNSAAGTIRQLDPKLAAERPLSFWAYQIGVTDGISFDSHWEALEWLRAHRFPVHPDVRKLETEDEVVAQCQAWEQRRGSLDFEIDGVVVKVNSAELQRRLGVVGRDPRWAIAWKFPPTTAVTKLNAIGWNPGKFGDLHPYAVLEPVQVGGRDDQARDAPQRGGPGPQGHPRRRGRDRAARRRRDPAGAVAGAARRRAQRPPAAVGAARALSGVRHADRQARGLGVHSLPQPRLRRPPLAAAQALRGRDGHRWPGREAGRPVHAPRVGAHRGRLLPADRRADRRAAGVRHGLGATS